MHSWIFGLVVFTNSWLLCICFIKTIQTRNIVSLFDNTVPPIWKVVSAPLKEQARQWFIKRALLKGIDWEQLTDQYKMPTSMDDMIKMKKRLENASILYPDYFLQAFHGYDDGNMNWLAAQENEAAALSMCSNYWPNICAMDSEKWVRNNVTANIRKYRRNHWDGAKILDVGCSGGISTEYLVRGFPEAKVVYGLDLSPYFVSVGTFRAEKNGRSDKVNYVHANAERTMFRDGEFDLIVCSFLFHEVPRDATGAILDELKRILAPGGVLAIVDLDPDVLKRMSQFRKWAFEVTEPHIYGYYDSNMTENLVSRGFTNVVKSNNDPVNCIWIASSDSLLVYTS